MPLDALRDTKRTNQASHKRVFKAPIRNRKQNGQTERRNLPGKFQHLLEAAHLCQEDRREQRQRGATENKTNISRQTTTANGNDNIAQDAQQRAHDTDAATTTTTTTTTATTTTTTMTTTTKTKTTTTTTATVLHQPKIKGSFLKT